MHACIYIYIYTHIHLKGFSVATGKGNITLVERLQVFGPECLPRAVLGSGRTLYIYIYIYIYICVCVCVIRLYSILQYIVLTILFYKTEILQSTP